MNPSALLMVDAAINLILGVLLMAFHPKIIHLLGVPPAEQSFYPTLLGAVLFGIGIALVIECFRRPRGLAGLGLGGAIAINLCGGLMLAIWLISGRLNLSLRGDIFLWCLAALLVGLSSIEGIAHKKNN
jgi:peptidoglycan/LPS O-acetylase OafA/YrhL